MKPSPLSPPMASILIKMVQHSYFIMSINSLWPHFQMHKQPEKSSVSSTPSASSMTLFKPTITFPLQSRPSKQPPLLGEPSWTRKFYTSSSACTRKSKSLQNGHLIFYCLKPCWQVLLCTHLILCSTKLRVSTQTSPIKDCDAH